WPKRMPPQNTMGNMASSSGYFRVSVGAQLSKTAKATPSRMSSQIATSNIWRLRQLILVRAVQTRAKGVMTKIPTASASHQGVSSRLNSNHGMESTCQHSAEEVNAA